ncbi:MAG: multiheme c-type cytochrome [Gammaproteobacteria bacterium]|jgi:nitrate/TMAO reductase-like tetraheme cytochrome c subunit
MKLFNKSDGVFLLKCFSKENCISLLPLAIVSFALFFLYSCIQNVPGSANSSSSKKNSEMLDKKASAMEQESSESPAKSLEKKTDSGEDNSEKDVALQAAANHEALFAESKFPSAATCGTCHPKHYKEWSVSSHSYAQLSPVYLSLSSEINELSSGTNGDFCLRCHSPIGANLGESPFMSNLDRHPTSREGITCVVCHRLSKNYNKRSGRLALVQGGLLEPVYGPKGNEEMERVLNSTDEYRVVTEEGKPGRKIHREAKQFASLSQPIFCGTCHDVTLFNGFRLEEAYSEYRTSPAAARGTTCQDCHMGKEQGKASGYDVGPGAIVGGKPTKDRKITSHFFAGPDYSVIHPGIFPHNAEAQEMASMGEWLKFDHKSGWGTDEFEDKVTEGMKFPVRWDSVDDRYDAREILNKQFEHLEFGRNLRLEVLRNGYHLGEIVTDQSSEEGIRFKAKVSNLTDGHNVPTGFTGERLVWLHVVVTDRDGKVVLESGDLDPNGDVRDRESSFVHNGELPLDRQLFDIRSRFVVSNLRGGERETIIPVPYPVTTIPFVRPSTNSLVFSGEPGTERNHRRGIEPLGHRWAKYQIDEDALTGKGPYKAKIELKAGMAPANLIGDIQGRGFDYAMSAREVVDGVAAGYEVLWEKEVSFKTSN